MRPEFHFHGYIQMEWRDKIPNVIQLYIRLKGIVTKVFK